MSNRFFGPAPRHSRRPRLEHLEDRTLPASHLSSLGAVLAHAAPVAVVSHASEDSPAHGLSSRSGDHESGAEDSHASVGEDHGATHGNGRDDNQTGDQENGNTDSSPKETKAASVSQNNVVAQRDNNQTGDQENGNTDSSPKATKAASSSVKNDVAQVVPTPAQVVRTTPVQAEQVEPQQVPASAHSAPPGEVVEAAKVAPTSAPAKPITTATVPGSHPPTREIVPADVTVMTSPDRPVGTPSGAVNGDGKTDTKPDDRAALADGWAASASTSRFAEFHTSQMLTALAGQESDAFAARTNDAFGATAEARALWFGGYEVPEDAGLAALVSLTDLNVLTPDDGSSGVDAAVSLLAGGHRLLPQRGSSVAPVATLLGEGAPEAPTPATSGRLNELFLNPLSGTPAAPAQAAATADGPARDAAHVENTSILAARLRPFLLLPLLGWCAVEVRRLRQRDETMPRRA